MTARLRHIAIIVDDPPKAAEFWRDSLGLDIIKSGEKSATLTDGTVHVALVKPGLITPQESVQPGFMGIHHIGFIVDDLQTSIEQLTDAQATPIKGDLQIPDTIDHLPFEMKWASPDGVVFDVSLTGWHLGNPPAKDS